MPPCSCVDRVGHVHSVRRDAVSGVPVASVVTASLTTTRSEQRLLRSFFKHAALSLQSRLTQLFKENSVGAGRLDCSLNSLFNLLELADIIGRVDVSMCRCVDVSTVLAVTGVSAITVSLTTTRSEQLLLRPFIKQTVLSLSTRLNYLFNSQLTS